MSNEVVPDHTLPTVQITVIASALAIAAIIVAALYFGRDVLVPVALAVLLSFVLAPLVRLLQRARFPRIAAVSLVVIITFGGLSILAAIMASQVTPPCCVLLWTSLAMWLAHFIGAPHFSLETRCRL